MATNQFAKIQSIKSIIAAYDNDLKMQRENVSITYGVAKSELGLDWNLPDDAEFIQLVLEPGNKAIYGPSVWITPDGAPALYIGNTPHVIANTGKTIEAGDLNVDFSIVYSLFKETTSHYVALTHTTEDGEILTFPFIWGQEYKSLTESQWSDDQISELKLVNSLGRKCTGEKLIEILAKYGRKKGSGRLSGSMTKMFSQQWLQALDQPILINFVGSEHKKCETKDGKSFVMVEFKLGENSHLSDIEVTLWNGSKVPLSELDYVEVSQKSVPHLPHLESRNSCTGMLQIFGYNQYQGKLYPQYRVSIQSSTELSPSQERPQLPFASSEMSIADLYN